MWAAIVAAMKGVGALVSVIRAIFSLIAEFQAIQEANKKAEAEKRRQEREKAADDLANAQTEEEFDNAQDRLVDNKP